MVRLQQTMGNLLYPQAARYGVAEMEGKKAKQGIWLSAMEVPKPALVALGPSCVQLGRRLPTTHRENMTMAK